MISEIILIVAYFLPIPYLWQRVEITINFPFLVETTPPEYLPRTDN